MLLHWTVPALSQDVEEAGDASRIEELEAALESRKTDRDDIHVAPVLVPDQYLDPAAKEALRRSLQSYYEYRTSGFEHRRRVFAWQLLSSKIIFVVVISLVAMGIYFSWLQFRAGLRREAGSGDEEHRTTIEATAKGIKVSSPVLGVIILVISFLFFYLYLVYVYPIAEIF
jgi:hypothetical protein